MIRAQCEVLTARRVGSYHSVTLVAPEIADQAKPGQFVEVGMPGNRSFLLRRPFSIHQASRRGGWAGTLEFVYDVHGPGTEWISEVRPHDIVDVVGPLGRPFTIPGPDLNNCLLVGGGYGAAPLYFLAEELRARGKRVDMVIGARNQERVFKAVEGKRLAVAISITTEDGSTGAAGKVTDVLPAMVARYGAQVVYACGPNGMLRAVASFCRDQGIPCQVAVEELMACGVGICWTCVVPVLRRDGRTFDNQRACREGPAFNGARVYWDRWLGPETLPDETPPDGLETVPSAPPGGYLTIPPTPYERQS